MSSVAELNSLLALVHQSCASCSSVIGGLLSPYSNIVLIRVFFNLASDTKCLYSSKKENDGFPLDQ